MVHNSLNLNSPVHNSPFSHPQQDSEGEQNKSLLLLNVGGLACLGKIQELSHGGVLFAR